MISSTRLDLTQHSVPEAGRTLLGAYDAAAPGDRVQARLDVLAPALHMWLIEAGARFDLHQDDADGVLLTLTRAQAPALTAAPGLHHIVSHKNGNLWTAERAARVARIDGATGEVMKVAAVAKKASHLAIDPDGKWLYLADFAGGELIIMDAETLTVAARLPAPGGAQLPVAAGPETVCLTGPGSGTLTIGRYINATWEHQIVSIGDTPHDSLSIDDGRHLFVACAGDGEVAKVRLDDGSIVGRIKTGAGAGHIAATPDGTRLFCANSFDGTLTAFSPDGVVFATVASGGWAHHPEVSHDGAHVYVANFLDDRVSVFDSETLGHVTDLETEAYPHEIAISPDGATLVLPGYSSDYARIYDAKTLRQRARVKVGAGSPHAAFTKTGERAYVTCAIDDHIAMVDIKTATVTDHLHLPSDSTTA